MQIPGQPCETPILSRKAAPKQSSGAEFVDEAVVRQNWQAENQG